MSLKVVELVLMDMSGDVSPRTSSMLSVATKIRMMSLERSVKESRYKGG